jgi:superfamily II DNA or RNA helicase
MEKLERVKRDVNGDFSADALDKVYSQKVVFGKILENLTAINPTLKPFVVFAPGVPHSLWTAQMLTSAGIPVAHIDGKSIWYNGKEMDSDSRNREMIFSLLRKNVIKGISNRFVLREGWNEPCISHAVLCPFGSLQSYIQAVGRILRPFEGKTLATVQDHGGNTLRFPDIDTDIDWDLAEKDKEVTARHMAAIKNGQIPEPIICPKCNANRTKGNTCPLCHHRVETETRTIVQVEGMLRKQTGKEKPRRKVKSTGRSDSDTWRGLYFGNAKYYPHRTFRQIYTNWARRSDFEKWLPKNLPLMPRNPDDWHKSVNSVPIQDLY